MILDHPAALMDVLRTALADPAVPPVDAALRILADELKAVTSWLAAHDDPAEASAQHARFAAMIQDTPSLRAHQRRAGEQLASAPRRSAPWRPSGA